LLGGGLAAACAGLAGGVRAQPAPWPLGVQLFTVDAKLKTDLPATLRALKAAGYQQVETAGLHGFSPAAFRAQVEAAGLTCKSAHVSMGDLLADLDARISDAKALGARWLVCSSPKPLQPLRSGQDWVPAMIEAMTLDAWRYNAEQLARMAPVVKRAGLSFAYHNHPMEFRDWGGVSGYDIILSTVAPDLLQMEMDLGWVAASGHDPVSMMKAHASRITLLHVKDMVRDASSPVGYRSVEVGRGMIEWPCLFAEALGSGGLGG
jgi:sugar phosphate isomerase/epimerase